MFMLVECPGSLSCSRSLSEKTCSFWKKQIVFLMLWSIVIIHFFRQEFVNPIQYLHTFEYNLAIFHLFSLKQSYLNILVDVWKQYGEMVYLDESNGMLTVVEVLKDGSHDYLSRFDTNDDWSTAFSKKLEYKNTTSIHQPSNSR